MPSGIMSVMNNTSKISYNKESGYKFEVNPQTVDWGGHFYYIYDSDGTQVEKKIAPLSNGGQYILRFDEEDTPYDHTDPSLTIYHYKDTAKSSTGLIYYTIIQELATHAVNILLSIGPIAR
ncbi:hypothetical protein ISF_06047 [Cordyceps fumosorosea ARSEF 2679]|uniref:Uncharacterized protein n=1 Tax=Cordyceps fumosorosea (strain ARSEF 2679) TaxID=1081104 RepID=A0A167SXM7_CORFA|nr:hypothetical protein ISF_06047 [Cordyceps fumosorosea ARSEF 2679]OAA60036.1 hypothetical protein ISF_06047 [Cordyceps fumosorosea ARSEF 2679]